MAGQVTGAQLHKAKKSAPSDGVHVALLPGGQHTFGRGDIGNFPINYETFWHLGVGKGPVEIGLPQTNEDVFYNTMVYNLIRRKMREGGFTGDLVVKVDAIR